MKDLYSNELVTTLLNLPDRQALEDFLEGILTDAELDALGVRLQIIKLLKSGVSQRMIVEELGVGIATITRGSKELKKGRFQSIE